MVTLMGLLGRRLASQTFDVNVPLVGVEVSAVVHDFVAEVKVNQYYRNNETSDIEATYHFPLDQASAVCGFQAEYEDGTLVNGVVKEKNEAKREYDLAISHGQQAQLLEEVRPDIFTVTVGRLPQSAHICIRITYITTLKAEGDASRFSLPTHIAERYTPLSAHVFGSPAPIPNIPERMRQFYKLSVKLKYSTRSRIVKLHSPTHPSDITVTTKDKTAEVSLTNIAMSKELVVLCEEEQAHQPRACVEIADDGSMVGLVTIFPKIEFRDLDREIIFIIDRSGSMGAWSAGKSQIQQAKEALLLFLRALPSSCSFNIIGFGSTYSALFPSSRQYDDASLAEATRYAERMEADMGGTELLKPLTFALDPTASAGPPPVSNLLSVVGFGCPGQHTPVFEAAQEGGVCSVCTRATLPGERQARCHVCSWVACDVCAFGCKARHALQFVKPHMQGMFCDICAKTLTTSERTISCRACDWDACEQCYTLWEAKRKSVFGVSARSVSGCPGQHALAQTAGAEGWNCDVCKRNLASGERAYGCRVCNWDACQPCAFGCKAGHELSVQTVGVDEMFCDVCARGLARGEMTMGCRACDWDACGACFQGWRDAAPMPREAAVQSKRQRQIFVLTDGQVSNESEVFDLVKRACSPSTKEGQGTAARAFCLGIGDDVSHHLVEGIARHGKGTAAFVTDGSSLRAKVLGQLKQALQPALDNVSVTWKLPPFADAAPASNPAAPAPEPVNTLLGLQKPVVAPPDNADSNVQRQVPSVCPPVFNGERFLSMVFFPKGQIHLPLSVTVTAASPDGPLDVTLDIKPQDDVLRGSIAHRIAARERIRELDDEFFRPARRFHGFGWGGVRSGAGPSTAEDARKTEAKNLALEYGLLSSFTSFVAVRPGADGARHTFFMNLRTVPQQPSFGGSAGLGGFGSGPTFGAGTAAGSGGRFCVSSFGGGFGAASFGGGGPTRGGQAQAFAFGATPSQAKREQATEGDDKGVFAVCMLQRADGSFLLDARLAAALGWELGDLEQTIGALIVGIGDDGNKAVLMGSIAAVAGLRILHADEQEVWELHEGKALGLLAGKGVGLSAVEACVAALRPKAGAASKKTKT